ncbi:MAG: hypothetical protein TR69_WS6001000519 [candidate division WS6 bacterium OLB20]|uniref:Type II toxin-antitoxin system RelE/ParE family toxin n=1 Tax=candidate division WS6 bacterium OLB20 TaxID=1617426 RepID=A0A136LXZ6_9BACT|nr:MAG: hypothetical protein TR69_WS6001000519 [candidate division WS6 bacterium OLB20]
MTEITYTSKAKDDLARIHWRTRERIISMLAGIYGKNPVKVGFKQVSDTELMKLYVEDHVILGKVEERQLSIITVQKRQPIRIPE